MTDREAGHRTPSNLSIPRPDSHMKRRIYSIISAGAKTLPGVAHRAGLTFQEAAALLTEMTLEGWFRRIDTSIGPVIVPAEPGEQLLDDDLYSAIISAIRAGADSVEEIAIWLGVTVDDPLYVTVGVAIRIANRHRNHH